MKFLTPLLALLPAAAIASPLVARTTPKGITIENLSRTCTTDKDASCTYKFTIDYEFGTQSCTVTDKADKPNLHSWYGVPCEENATWEISWGWDYIGDFTVMTVVDEPNQYEAFFGYKSPNLATSYKDQGPNAVQHT